MPDLRDSMRTVTCPCANSARAHPNTVCKFCFDRGTVSEVYAVAFFADRIVTQEARTVVVKVNQGPWSEEIYDDEVWGKAEEFYRHNRTLTAQPCA